MPLHQVKANGVEAVELTVPVESGQVIAEHAQPVVEASGGHDEPVTVLVTGAKTGVHGEVGHRAKLVGPRCSAVHGTVASSNRPSAAPTCAAGATCPAMRQTWRDGPYIRLKCDKCGRTCSAPVVPQRGTAIVMPAALKLRPETDRAGVVA